VLTLAPTPGRLGVWAVITPRNIYTYTTMAKALTIDLSDSTVTTDHPSPAVSSRYGFIRTEEVTNNLLAAGWQFDGGTRRATRSIERCAYALHVLRFSHPALPTLIDGTRPQAVVLNSHQGSSKFQLLLGAFRIACANGLIVQSMQATSLSLRHSAGAISEVAEGAARLIDSAPRVFAGVEQWSRIDLNWDRQVELASRAALIRWDDGEQLDPRDLLTSRRREDSGTDLWKVFNRVQESVIRGGVPVTRQHPNGEASTRRATGIRNPGAVVDMNQRLWSLAEEFAITA